MSPDALFQLGIVSVRLNTSLTETPENPETPETPDSREYSRARLAVGRGRPHPEHFPSI
jgi:hypothetical protein